MSEAFVKNRSGLHPHLGTTVRETALRLIEELIEYYNEIHLRSTLKMPPSAVHQGSVT
jgi:hypothetical protein